MKYIAIIDIDDYKDFKFFEDGNGKYMVGKDAGATANGGWIPLYFTECKQEPILDKIRADIIDLAEGWNGMQAKNVPLGAVLKIIDKHTSGKKE